MQFNLCVFILFLYGFNTVLFAQEKMVVEKIEFTTLIRGAHKEVLITKDCVDIVKQGRSDPEEINVKVKIKKEEWLALLKTIKDIPLRDMPTYQAPSNKRAHDGAWHSSIIITTSDKLSFRHSFDNEEPNEKLLPLMTAIRDLVDEASVAEKN